MEYNEEIKLIKYTDGENELGDPIKVREKRSVLASKLDYRNKDFYQAMASGLRPSMTFAINKYEYEEEQELEYNNKLYKIIDVFPVKARDESEFETISLICEGVVNS